MILQKACLSALAGCVRSRIAWPGKWRVRAAAIRLARRIGSSMGLRTVRTTPGFQMELDLADWVDQHIFATGTYEDAVGKVFEALLRPGEFFVDVGANIGYFSLLAAEYVGESGQIIAFEPVSSTRQRLHRNVELNSRTNVEIRSEAASDSSGVAVIHVGPPDHSGISSLRELEGGASEEQIATIRLDEVLTESKPPKLIKIDVEGAELRVLRGIQDGLREWGERAPVLVIEFAPEYLAAFGDSGLRLDEFLTQAGYRCWRITWDRLLPMTEQDVRGTAQFNLLAIRQSPPTAIQKMFA